MHRRTDRLIALQFMAVVLPIGVVLLAQIALDTRRAAALEHSRPLRILAAQARAHYTTFTNGAADAVDTGTLGGQSVAALQNAATELAALRDRGQDNLVGTAPAVVAGLAAAVRPGASLRELLPLRARIIDGDTLTRTIDAEFGRRDEAVVKDAIESAKFEQGAVVAAMLLSALITVYLVMETRKRLRQQLNADIETERRRRAELEILSIRFGMATRAARAGVYEIADDGAVWWSDTMHELYARPSPDFQPTTAGWMALLHADDQAAARSAIDTALTAGGALRSQYRVLRPDGSICQIASLAAVVADPFDGRRRLVGIDLDVTERVEADERERKLQVELRDASRRAGMAEIATNVLHNVGNVLNSVNVSTRVAIDRVRASAVPGLSKVVVLLDDHAADLGTFVTSDPRGQHLPAYLAQLCQHLTETQRTTLQELQNLAKNIEHIKEIVAMQQGYAKRAAVTESVPVANLLDDGVRMHAEGFKRHGIALHRELAANPSITVDKHKVLQILVNLLRNAQHACGAAGGSAKQVVVRVSECATGVSIAVADNGIGIHPEHLPRLFTHGFTTKPDGHGFGLHGGALLARELGGALRVASAGPGRGATFTLDLPKTPPEHADGR